MRNTYPHGPTHSLRRGIETLESASWFKLAHRQDHRESVYEYGLILANGRDKSMVGMGCIPRSAAMGYSEAQVQLGLYLRHGSNNFDIDLPEALYNFTQAAQLDHPVALAELADMHANGLGTPLDTHKAFECAVRSAEAGYPQGQFYLAECYFTGTGAEPDETLAFDWLAKSAEQSHPEAMFAIASAVTSGRTSAVGIADAKRYLNHCLQISSLRNQARVGYADYLLKFEPGLEGMIVAASLLQPCFESEGPTTAMSRESATLVRKTIQDVRQRIPQVINDPKLVEGALIASAWYDEQG